MKIAILLLAVFCLSLAAPAQDAADLFAYLPKDTETVLATEDAVSVLDRFLGLVDEGLIPLPADLEDYLRNMRMCLPLLEGPYVSALEPAEISVAKLASTEEEFFQTVREQFGETHDESRIAPGAVSWDTFNGKRDFALVRDGLLYMASDEATLRDVLDAQPNPDADLAAFYRQARLAERARGGMTLLSSDDTMEQAVGDMSLPTFTTKPGPAFSTWVPWLPPSFEGPYAWTWSWDEHGSALEMATRLPETNPVWEALTGRSETAGIREVALPTGPLGLAGNFRDFTRWLRALEFFMESIDPRIRDEFIEELGELNEDAGIDVERDIVRSLDGTGSVAFSPDEDDEPVLWRIALGVRDAERLKTAGRSISLFAEAAWVEDGDTVETTLFGPPSTLRFDDQQLTIEFAKGEPEAGEADFEWWQEGAFQPAMASPAPALAIYVSVPSLLRSAPRHAEDEVEALAELRHALATLGVQDQTLRLRLDVAPRIEPLFAVFLDRIRSILTGPR